jgi:hypothetical protein
MRFVGLNLCQTLDQTGSCVCSSLSWSEKFALEFTRAGDQYESLDDRPDCFSKYYDSTKSTAYDSISDIVRDICFRFGYKSTSLPLPSAFSPLLSGFVFCFHCGSLLFPDVGFSFHSRSTILADEYTQGPVVKSLSKWDFRVLDTRLNKVALVFAMRNWPKAGD